MGVLFPHKDDTNVITPPAIQAANAAHCVPAEANTTDGFRKIPLPMIMPTTIASASIKPNVFCFVFICFCSYSYSFFYKNSMF